MSKELIKVIANFGRYRFLCHPIAQSIFHPLGKYSERETWNATASAQVPLDRQFSPVDTISLSPCIVENFSRQERRPKDDFSVTLYSKCRPDLKRTYLLTSLSDVCVKCGVNCNENALDECSIYNMSLLSGS